MCSSHLRGREYLQKLFGILPFGGFVYSPLSIQTLFLSVGTHGIFFSLVYNITFYICGSSCLRLVFSSWVPLSYQGEGTVLFESLF